MYQLACVDVYKYPGDDKNNAYIVDLIPTSAGLVASSSDQSLSLFDPYKTGLGPITRIPTDHGNLSVARPYSPSGAHVCSAGENGTISLWDLRLDPARAQAQALRIDMGGKISP